MLQDSDSDDDIPILLNLDTYQPPETATQRTQSTELNVNREKGNNEDLPLVPITILSGFLGSGKTSLIQFILRSPNHKKKIAIIENEFSGTSAADLPSNNIFEREQQQQGLSIETLIARDGSDNLNSLTDLIELPNGCICCTVKDSLVETLENLLEKKRDLDYIIIECSGMANPGPIASIFWLDDALGSRIRLDGIVTCVDARNIEMQLRETNSNSTNSHGQGKETNDDFGGGDEAAQQIAFADRIIVNKVDLLNQPNEQVASVIDRIRKINATAPVRTTTFSQVPDLDWILDTKCFDVEKARDAEVTFSGITNCADGIITMEQAQVCSEPNCAMCIKPSTRSTETGSLKPRNHSIIEPNSVVEGQPTLFCSPCANVSSQNLPPPIDHHRHTSSIRTVALIEKGSIDLKRMNAWLASILWPDQDQDDSVLKAQLSELEKLGKVTTRELLEQRQQQSRSGKMKIFRIKGIMSVKHPSIDDDMVTDDNDLNKFVDDDGFDRRKYIVQAVNDLWEIHAASESLCWESDELPQSRLCKLVVIGRYLDRSALSSGFMSCMV